MKTNTIKKFSLYALGAAVLVCLIWLFSEFLLPVLLPFAAAFAFSCFLTPCIGWLSAKTKLRRGFWSAVVIILAIGAVSWLVWFASSILIREGTAALSALSEMLENEDNPVNTILDKINASLEKLNVGGATSLTDAASGLISASIGTLSTWAASLAGRIFSAAPSFLFSFAVFVIALFYFCADRAGILADMKKYMPGSAYSAVSSAGQTCCKALKSIAAAYGTIMVITFAELFVGFIIVGVDFAFLAAILTAVIDFLPILGAGTVLVPWAIILFFTGESAAGVKMLILFAVMSAVRQVIEPKIVGKRAGVHPLTALISVFAGFRFFGVVGMIIAPIILNVISVFADLHRGE